MEVINHIILHSPEEGLEKFEEISYLLKNKANIDMKNFLKIDGMLATGFNQEVANA